MKLEGAFKCMSFTAFVTGWMLLCDYSHSKECNSNSEEKGGLYLSEIMPFWEGSPSNVWVELYNSGINDISLSQWRLEDSSGVGFSFPETAGLVHSNGSVVVFFGTENDAPPLDKRKGKWFFVSPFEKGRLFLTNGVKKCMLVSISESGRTVVDSVSWSQSCTTSFSSKKMREAFASEDERLIREAMKLIRVGPAQLDVNCTLGRIFMGDENECHLHWEVFCPSATSQGMKNYFPPPNQILGPSDGKRISHHTQLKVSCASVFPVSIQIAKDSDFNNIVFEKNNIVAMPFNISDNIVLEKGLYYWHLRGEEKNKRGVSQQSPWSDVRSFIIE